MFSKKMFFKTQNIFIICFLIIFPVLTLDEFQNLQGAIVECRFKIHFFFQVVCSGDTSFAQHLQPLFGHALSGESFPCIFS